MKPFDLQKALAGEPVCLRDGTPVSHIAHFPEAFPDERVVFAINGKMYFRHDNGQLCDNKEDHLDLMMVTSKQRMWMNVYRGTAGGRICGNAHTDYHKACDERKESKMEYIGTLDGLIDEE